MQYSFIIPSYQQGKFIKDCLDSILDQNLPDGTFEVWVIDGGSTDETESIVRAHPLQPHFVSEPDRGQAHAINKGVKRTRGEYIAWINSDDYYNPKAFFFISQYLKEHPDTPVLYGEGDIVDGKGNFVERYPTEDWKHQRLADKCFLCQPSVLFRRDVYEKIGPVNESLHLALDLEYWMRAGKEYAFTRLPLRIACSRHYEGTKSQSQPLQMQIEALLAGHEHLGIWSRRRLWSVTENRMLMEKPKLQNVLKPGAVPKWQYGYFWAIKSLRYFVLRVRPSLDEYLQRLLQQLPARPSPSL